MLAVAAIAGIGCGRKPGLPEPGTKLYRDFCSAFYTGLAGLQSGEDVRAKDDLTAASQLVPGEPAAWANLSVFQLRRQEFDAALKSAEAARGLAPDNSQIEALLGQIESKRGEVAACLTHFKKAIDLDGANLRAIYALAMETERQGNDAEAERWLERVLALRPANTGTLLEVARLEAKTGDSKGLRASLQTLQSQSTGWPEAARKQLTAVVQASTGSDVRAAALPVQFLRNVLLRAPAYQRSMDEVRTPTTIVFEPFKRLLRLPSPSAEPAPADTQLQFKTEAASDQIGPDKLTWVGAIDLNDESPAAVVHADARSVLVNGSSLPLPAVTSTTLPIHAIAGADLNYDFKTDLIVATDGGLKIYRQVDPKHFTDVTADTKLDAKTLKGSYTGAWAFDVDLDGDLDIVLGVKQGEPLVLRNNGDGTFAILHPFQGVDGLLSFAAADIDGDGDPDVGILDRNGQLIVFSNQRLGEYRRRPVPAGFEGGLRSVAAADLNGDGLPDLIVLRSDLSIAQLSSKPDGEGWDQSELARGSESPVMPSPADLLIGDLDNNGALDLVVGDQAFVNDGKNFSAVSARLQGSARALIDLNNDGRLDFISLSGGSAVEQLNYGAKNYHWQTVRTKAASATGDQRINSFGIGGEIEVRSGLLTQKQIISSPILHFGLGEQTTVDFARIVWPNGFVQAEFALKADQTVLALQRLKGSCPFLFTWDGARMRFVKDTAPWSPALGLHINAQQVAGIYQTEEWFKIPGDALKPSDGYYDLRVTAEYWETFYIDHYSLMVVDHPAGTQIYADERFAVPPPPLKIYATSNPKPFARATDDNGQDVSQVVGALDGRYLDNFDRGQYQGVTRDHWVELQLPSEAPVDNPLYLIADGWMHPSDGTTNVAMGQNSGPQPHGLSIEVQDRTGRWVTARDGLGFPAGRNKTVVLALRGIFQTGTERKFRLRTNLEVYWDRLEWATGAENASLKTIHLPLSSAELSFRGFSAMGQVNRSSPEIPTYERLVADGQRWRDLQGYVTRYGDVRELLSKIDDRMVITNAGDELRVKFAVQPSPAAGWVRDYIMVGDGWIKDGDYNSVFSKTVLPLPYHRMKDYSTAPAALEDDLAYRLHPSDWQTYHTRYIMPTDFVTALWRQ